MNNDYCYTDEGREESEKLEWNDLGVNNSKVCLLFVFYKYS